MFLDRRPENRVPASRTMEEKEEVVFLRRIPGVQGIDPGTRALEQRIVFGHRLRRGVPEIRQQREMQQGVAIGEMVDLQRLDQVIHAFRAGEHGRHDHHRAQNSQR